MKGRFRAVLLCALGCICFVGCTSNPVGDDTISAGKRQVTGKATLDTGDDQSGVYVWLEGFDIGTQTDPQGNFKLTLPPPSSQTSEGGVDGAFRLFYYVANYSLTSANVVVKNGEFVFSSGDINKDGEISGTKSLTKFLDIKTILSRNSIRVNSDSRIAARVTLTAISDSVTVLFPNSIGEFLGAIFLRNLDTQEVFIIKGPPTEEVDKELITRTESSRSIEFSLIVNPVPVGRYEVLPYLLVRHESIPAQLMETLGNHVENLTPGYLQIPFKIDAAILEVTN